jgi:hypothetical protein
MKIPVSRIVRDYHYYSQSLADAQAKLDMERSQEINTKRLRELTENVAIAKDKADRLTASIDSAFGKQFTDWAAEDLAAVLTGLDVRLLIMLNPKDSFTGLQEFTDFQSYFMIILENELSDFSEQELAQRIELAIKTAFYCIYVYRNLSSGCTIISVVHKVLENIQIRSKLPSKILLLESHLHEMIQNIGQLGFDMLFHHFKSDQVTVIPNAFYIKEGFDDIHSSCIVHSSKGSGIILSEQGQKTLQKLISMVECCKGETKIMLEISKTEIKNTLPKLDLYIPSLQSTDLKDIGIGDLVLEHWILTRPILDPNETK